MIEDFKAYARSVGDEPIHFQSFCFEAESFPIEEMFDQPSVNL
tara:strand:+ start:179 stop:307 length:129 start_codon:yes stop_codon:yes gene_type:complete